MNFPSQRLAAHAKAHQVELSLKADAAALAIDRAMARHWQSILADLRARRPIRSITFRALIHAAQAEVWQRMRALAYWTHRQIARSYSRAIPLSWLRHAARKEIGLIESRDFLEDDKPGVLRFALRALGLDFPVGSIRDLARRLREPARDELDADEQREAFAALLFPPPPEEEVARIFRRPIAGMTWEERIASLTRRGEPEQIASTITTSFALGKMPSEIARDILPFVDGIRSTARRVARTASMQVAHDIQRQADEGLEEAEMLTGWQTHATLDENTRTWHAKRNGTIYYLNPGPGQNGRAQMPEPPMEPEDPAERPAGTPQLAHNCRCRNSPVLTAPAYLTTPRALEVFRNAEGKLIPDTVAYHDWFAQADERRKMRAVGVRRYQQLKDEWQGKPPWEAFIDPGSGDLMPLDRLRAESPEERAERAGEVRRGMDERRAKLRQVGLMGFELAA